MAKRPRDESTQPKPVIDPHGNEDGLEDGTRILRIFRRYLMTTGQMLCLNGKELETYRQSLKKLVSEGLLTAESFHGGYSLTEMGFSAMKQLPRESEPAKRRPSK